MRSLVYFSFLMLVCVSCGTDSGGGPGPTQSPKSQESIDISGIELEAPGLALKCRNQFRPTLPIRQNQAIEPDGQSVRAKRFDIYFERRVRGKDAVANIAFTWDLDHQSSPIESCRDFGAIGSASLALGQWIPYLIRPYQNRIDAEWGVWLRIGDSYLLPEIVRRPGSLSLTNWYQRISQWGKIAFFKAQEGNSLGVGEEFEMVYSYRSGEDSQGTQFVFVLARYVVEE